MGRAPWNGIYLNSTSNVSLQWMQLNDFTNSGIYGSGVVDMSLTNSTVNGVNGTNVGADEGSLIFDGLTGTSNFSR